MDKTEAREFLKGFSEEELRKADEEAKKLFNDYEPSKHKTVEEKLAACDAIPIEEFRQMGIDLLKKYCAAKDVLGEELSD